jgi:hypothetical protein
MHASNIEFPRINCSKVRIVCPELSLFEDDSGLACLVQLTLPRRFFFLIGLGVVSSLNEATFTFRNLDEIVNVFRMLLKANLKYCRSMGL